MKNDARLLAPQHQEIASGIQAPSAGIGLSNSIYGRIMSSAQRERPLMMPRLKP